MAPPSTQCTPSARIPRSGRRRRDRSRGAGGAGARCRSVHPSDSVFGNSQRQPGGISAGPTTLEELPTVLFIRGTLAGNVPFGPVAFPGVFARCYRRSRISIEPVPPGDYTVQIISPKTLPATSPWAGPGLHRCRGRGPPTGTTKRRQFSMNRRSAARQHGEPGRGCVLTNSHELASSLRQSCRRAGLSAHRSARQCHVVFSGERAVCRSGNFIVRIRARNALGAIQRVQ